MHCFCLNKRVVYIVLPSKNRAFYIFFDIYMKILGLLFICFIQRFLPYFLELHDAHFCFLHEHLFLCSRHNTPFWPQPFHFLEEYFIYWYYYYNRILLLLLLLLFIIIIILTIILLLIIICYYYYCYNYYCYYHNYYYHNYNYCCCCCYYYCCCCYNYY